MICNNSIVQTCVQDRIYSLEPLTWLDNGQAATPSLHHTIIIWAVGVIRGNSAGKSFMSVPHCDDCIHSNQLHWTAGDLFTPLLFLLFNLGDLVGRLLSGIGPYVNKSPPATMLVGYSLSRIVLAAALVFCHVVTPHTWRAPEVFR